MNSRKKVIFIYEGVKAEEKLLRYWAAANYVTCLRVSQSK